MRQLLIRVPDGEGTRVAGLATEHEAMDVTILPGVANDHPVDLVIAHLPNPAVGPLVGALEGIDDLRVSILPTGVLVLAPPAQEVPQQVRDVGPRSPLEVFLAGLQSVGSWRGFLGFAATAGAVVWLGLITDTIYLLVAAMLLAPFASPAVNTAIATARGDARLLGRSVLRYAAAIGLTVLVSAVLSLLYGVEVETQLMADVANVSVLALILPLTAGVAGGLHLISGERNSLVSGAAVGILVAASLAPPAGIVGIAAVIGEWEMVATGLYLVALQLVGINLAAAAVFRLYGLTPGGPRYARGTARAGWIAGAVAAVLFVGLVAFQVVTPAPFLVRSSLAQDARQLVAREVRALPGVHLANADVRFTRADIPGQSTLLIVLHVQRSEDSGPAGRDVSELVARQVRRVVAEAHPNVTPLVDVTVLDPP